MNGGTTQPVKVAILGGGVGALSAALALTDPARKQRCDVTVYTMGWRLGGKGASGRDAERGQRIEEHGIHVWFGFYDNAFRLLDGCYRDLVEQGWRTPEGRPVSVNRCIGASPNDGAAFHPHEDFVVNEQRTDWSMWRLRVPRNDLVPGDGQPVPPEISLAFVKLAEMLEAIADIRAQTNREALESMPTLPAETDEEKAFRGFVEQRLGPLREGTFELQPEDYLRQALDGLAAPALVEAIAAPQEGLFDAQQRFRIRLRFIAWTLRCARAFLRIWSNLSDKAHRLYLSCDTFAAIATGLSRDVFAGDRDPEQGMRALDEIELRTWLGKHGGDADYLLSNPTVRFIYNSAFSFVDGNHQSPSIAAGSALRGVLRLFLTYKGAFAYRMAAGMGDVVFSPIHEILRRRGVKFRFFHRVDGLGLADSDGRPVIDQIRLTEQVRLTADAYDPFVWVKDFPCWPSHPRFDQIKNGAALAEAVRGGLNLEDPGSDWRDARPRVLQRGVDFDQVVLGIPVEALKPITRELCADPKIGSAWTAMLKNTATTPTQGFQIWFRAGLKDLGWDDPPPVFGTYVEPIDTYIDMTPALALEERRHDDIKNLSYFCGVFERRAGETQPDAMSRAVDNAIEHLTKRCAYIWPALVTGGKFDWSLLWGATRDGNARDNFLRGQFARANVLPSELYTLNLPSTSRFRLRPDAAAHPEDGESCANLWLAGDWTQNPINLGCVEATVMSGLAAARGLSGEAIEIVGERDDYLWESIGKGTRVLSGQESLVSPSSAPTDPPHTVTWDDSALVRLKDAVATFDRPAAEGLCTALLRRLDSGEEPLPEALVTDVLSTLRRKRHFDLMRQVADAFLQAGTEAPQVRRQYAQALIDQGDLTAALAVLGEIADESNLDLDERAEALGLLGRAYKQRYVNAPRARRAAQALQKAVESYHRGYQMGRSNQGWHAVNTVALLQRAGRDGVGLGAALHAIDTAGIVRDTLDRIGGKPKREIDAWDYAVEAEANLALGDPDEAIACLKEYVARTKSADAFEVASTLRQLEEVWKLTADAEPGATIIPFLQGELLERQGGRLDLPATDVQRARGNLANLQKILGSERAVTLGWYRTGLERCRLVARISDRFERGGGTGFLVRAGDFLRCDFPDELVVLTNAHVLEPKPGEAGTLHPRDALVRFEVAREASESPPVYNIREIAWSSPREELDATLARLDPVPVGPGISGCPIAPREPDPKTDGRVYIIGHPQGGALSLSLYDNLLIDRDDRLLHYRTPTEPGSSGSPVFDRNWNLIALHHAGGLAMRRLNGKAGVYPANEGILVGAIQRGVGGGGA